MIKRIEISNFRSILKSSIQLNNLTVVVGANATGKSNLIKTIDFISDIARFGLQESIYKRGGYGEILPKQHLSTYGKEISFKIDFDIEPPDNWCDRKLPPLEVAYELAFTKTKKNTLKVSSERIMIKSILLLAYFIENRFELDSQKVLELSEEKVNELSESKIQILKDSKNNLTYNLEFDINKKDNLQLFVSWLGVGSFFRETSNVVSLKGVHQLTKELLNLHKSAEKRNELTILSSKRAIFGFSIHLKKILSEVQTYGRYDLLINELRQEQPISSGSRVSISGDNIPSIIKKFAKENKEGWERVLTTMSNISPYFASVSSESLRAGKEYLVFKEVFEGRDIESWESSDGTLRALAILISVESHKSGSTVLIEEPEHGLHPWAVKELISHIKEVIKLRHLQVILTTHSQQVLECIEEKELLITERDSNGTKYSTIKQIIPNSDITMGEIGDLWTSGLLKGVPTSW